MFCTLLESQPAMIHWFGLRKLPTLGRSDSWPSQCCPGVFTEALLPWPWPPIHIGGNWGQESVSRTVNLGIVGPFKQRWDATRGSRWSVVLWSGFLFKVTCSALAAMNSIICTQSICREQSAQSIRRWLLAFVSKLSVQTNIDSSPLQMLARATSANFCEWQNLGDDLWHHSLQLSTRDVNVALLLVCERKLGRLFQTAPLFFFKVVLKNTFGQVFHISKTSNYETQIWF